MAAIIELREVSFAYGQTESLALKDLNLTIEEGGFVGVIGPSGAGKSTLASVLSGAIPHHYTGRLYGETRVAGLDTCEASLTDIATIVGSVLQDIDARWSPRSLRTRSCSVSRTSTCPATRSNSASRTH